MKSFAANYFHVNMSAIQARLVISLFHLSLVGRIFLDGITWVLFIPSRARFFLELFVLTGASLMPWTDFFPVAAFGHNKYKTGAKSRLDNR